jgi:hypothetical protein
MYFKISNGEDIIASCDMEDSEKFLIRNPFTLQQVRTSNSETHLMMYPWVPSPTLMSGSFIFMKSNIIAVSLAPESFVLAHSRASNALSMASEPTTIEQDTNIEDENEQEEVPGEEPTFSSSTRTIH